MYLHMNVFLLNLNIVFVFICFQAVQDFHRNLLFKLTVQSHFKCVPH